MLYAPSMAPSDVTTAYRRAERFLETHLVARVAATIAAPTLSVVALNAVLGEPLVDAARWGVAFGITFAAASLLRRYAA